MSKLDLIGNISFTFHWCHDSSSRFYTSFFSSYFSVEFQSKVFLFEAGQLFFISFDREKLTVLYTGGKSISPSMDENIEKWICFRSRGEKRRTKKNINRGAMENETFWCESIHISLYILEMWMNLFLSTNLSQFIFFMFTLSHSSSSFLSSYFYFCFSVSFSVSFVVWNSCCSLLTNNEAKMSNTSSRTSPDKHSLT